MNRISVLAISALAAAATFVALQTLWEEPPAPAPVQPPPKESPHGPNPFGSGPASTAEPAPERSGPAARESEASREFFSTTDLKPFVTQARANPSSGSYLYAALAIRECDDYANERASIEALAPPIPPRRQAAIDSFEQRCARITGPELRQLGRLAEEGVAAKDIGRAALASMALPAGQAANVQVLQQLIDTLPRASEPGVVWATAYELALSAEDLAVGRQPMSESEQTSLPAALMLASCELGVPCDASHPLLRWECMAKGLCDVANLQALFQRVDHAYWRAYVGSGRYEDGVALQLRDRIVRGVREKDATVLTVRPAQR